MVLVRAPNRRNATSDAGAFTHLMMTIGVDAALGVFLVPHRLLELPKRLPD
jgi:hypothetical protein